ncbi:MAG: DUF1049 domain-containing protein [SAR324 cluster bacterium]|nr:DUF1049 domain-containing protein [SAR324 cluster bacterium]
MVMAKRIFSFILWALVLVFTLENFDIVQVRFIAGPLVKMPLAFVLVIGFVAGYLLAAISTRIKIYKRDRELEDND